jgi:hypothetical protein
MAARRFVCAFVLILSISGMVLAQRAMTVAEVVSFIKSAIKQKQDDRLVADYLLKRVKMKERLDERTVEDLQGMGAGPRTTAALHKLSAESASLAAAPPPQAPPPPPPQIPPPNSVDQKAILNEIRENALNYSKGLPNYICTQLTRRNVDTTGTGDHFREVDTIQEQLSFSDGHEKYVVVMISGKMVTGRDHDKLGGATSSGEFGSMLYDVFNPATDAEFEWDHWATLRKRRMYVYAYQVARDRSRFDIYHGPSDRHLVSAYKGLIYADVATKTVMRVTLECVNMPVDFPIQEVKQVLDYDTAKIADLEFILPLRSELNSRESRYLVKNITDFHLYRKFTTEEKITFDTVDEIPESKEESVKPPVKKQP